MQSYNVQRVAWVQWSNGRVLNATRSLEFRHQFTLFTVNNLQHVAIIKLPAAAACQSQLSFHHQRDRKLRSLRSQCCGVGVVWLTGAMVSLLTALQAMDSHKFSVIPLAHSSQLLLRDYKLLHSAWVGKAVLYIATIQTFCEYSYFYTILLHICCPKVVGCRSKIVQKSKSKSKWRCLASTMHYVLEVVTSSSLQTPCVVSHNLTKDQSLFFIILL